jgi:peptide deformylase
VILIGDPLLRKKCAKVNNFNLPDVKKIKSGLKSTLHHLQKIHKKGGGLAALLIGNTVTSLFENI